MDSSSWLAVNFLILVLSSLNVQVVKPCSPDEHKTLSSTKGRFSSPDYPKYFQKATQCNWLIKVPSGFVVTLEFSKFEVGHEAECSNRESRTNFVEVRDGSEFKNRTIGIFCGTSSPREISSTGNQMWIRYETSGYRSTKFEARYSATQDSPASTIILLAFAAIIGTILCISVTIAIVKRKHRDHDDEAGLSPSRDNGAEMDHNRACAMDQLPAMMLGVENYAETSPTDEQQPATRSLFNEHTSHVSGHVDTTEVHLHRQSPCSHDNGGIGEQNLVITDVGDIDNENHDTPDRLRSPDKAENERRESCSGSVLTSTKVIFVQDSSSSRCSTSSSDKSFE